MKIRNSAKDFLAATFLVLMALGQGQAATITGGSTLLDSTYANQLESWLGEGSITLTNIFTKASGDTSYDFHDAADGQGRTFVVMSATQQGTTSVIGGYNPQSWNSSGSYNTTALNADRTAFLFNLTTSNIYRQALSSTEVNYGAGEYQTYNYIAYGPTFGGGHDLWVQDNLTAGYSLLYSYAAADSLYDSVVTGSYYGEYQVAYGDIEVFTISVTPVPEPEIYAMMGLGLGLLGWVGRRKRLQAA